MGVCEICERCFQHVHQICARWFTVCSLDPSCSRLACHGRPLALLSASPRGLSTTATPAPGGATSADAPLDVADLGEEFKADVDALRASFVDGTREVCTKLSARASALSDSLRGVSHRVEESARTLEHDRANFVSETRGVEVARGSQAARVVLDVGGHRYAVPKHPARIR